MQFTSISFMLFSTGVLLGYYLLPPKVRWSWLLAASYGFYGCAGMEYLVFILLTTANTYAVGRLMGRNLEKQDAHLALHQADMSLPQRRAYKAEVRKRNRLWLVTSLVIGFGLLALCKGLLIDPFRAAAKDTPLSFLSLGLPLGISFYIFQSAGYVVDVYRGSVKAEKNFFRFALFVSFFPQLIQGPISRFSQLAPQLYDPHDFNGKKFSFGLQRMLWGYFKKMVVADRIAVAMVALKGPEDVGVSFLILTVFYGVRIYGDFTGGIDIAIGLAEAMGIQLPENFIRPYFSKNIGEYWRRWHVTLGTWMKDYIFYPISISRPMLNLSRVARCKLGNFGKRLPIYVASVVTWICTGVWHGLTLNFVVWGLLNCFVIVVSEELTPLYQKFHGRFHLKDQAWYGAFEMLRTFMLMNLIRACDLFPNVGDYFARVGSVFTTMQLYVLWDGTLLKLGLNSVDYGILGISVLLMLAVSLFREKRGSVREFLWKKPVALWYVVIFLLFVAVLLLGSYGIGYNVSNFIYDQF